MKNFINNMDDSSITKDEIEDYLYSDNWVKFAAVSYFAGNPDDMRNNYNNHYIYFSSENKAIFIPYDYDRCLGVSTSNLDMSSYSPFDTRAELANQTQKNPVYLYTVTGTNNNYTEEYKAALQEVVDSGWLNYDNYLKYYNIVKNNYSDVVIPDSHIKLWKQDLNESKKTYTSSDMAFSESNSKNTAVSTYLSNIKAKYEAVINNNTTLTIYYNGFTNPNIHYSIGGNSNWTSAPGIAMSASTVYSGFPYEYTMDLGDATSAIVCFNDGNGNWDNNNSKNYAIDKAGVYTIKDGAVTASMPQ